MFYYPLIERLRDLKLQLFQSRATHTEITKFSCVLDIVTQQCQYSGLGLDHRQHSLGCQPGDVLGPFATYVLCPNIKDD